MAMNKKQFLEKLHKNLSKLPKEEVEDIMRDFEEYFEIGNERNRTEEEIANSFGDIRMLARQIKAESFIKKAEESTSASNITRAVFTTVGLSFFNLIVVLPVFLVIAAIIIALFSSAVSIGAAGISGTVTSFFYPFYDKYLTFSVNPAVLIFMFIGIGALGVLFFTGVVYLTKFLFRQIVRYLKFNISIIKGRRSVSEEV